MTDKEVTNLRRKNRDKLKIMEERFKKPTDQQLVEFAILFNNGRIERQKLTDMVAYGTMIVDRLYDNGNILQPSKKEIEDGTN